MNNEDMKLNAYLFVKALEAGNIIAATKAVGKYAEDKETAFVILQPYTPNGKLNAFRITYFVGEITGLKVKRTQRTIAVVMKDYTIHEVLCLVCEKIKEKYPFIIVPENYKELAWDFIRV